MNKIPVLLSNVIVSGIVLALLVYSNDLRQQPTAPSPAWYTDAKTIQQLAFLITLFQVYFLVGMVTDRLTACAASASMLSDRAAALLLAANRIDAPADAKELTVIFDGLAFDFFVTEAKTSVGVTVENAATFGNPDTQCTDVFVNKRTLKVTTVYTHQTHTEGTTSRVC